MLRITQILLWRTGAIVAFGLGITGLAIPVLPTVPFLIVSAWAAGRGWPALERWMLDHHVYGPHIRRWRERGSVPRRAKLLATAMMLASSVGLQFTHVVFWLKIGAPALMFMVAVWLWRRPED